MTDVVEPGTRLMQRYRLEEHLGAAGAADSSVTTTGGGQVKGATYWQARDELLDRPVGVCLLRSGTSYAERVLAAARQAAVLTDARFLRILDAAEADGIVYVVTEWVPAPTLADLVADGPLPPAEARELAAEVAAALAAAHEAGLTHLVLRPENVLRTAHGQVKLSGLAVDAAARGERVDDPAEAARRDTAGAGALLYTALTARWPGVGDTAVPPAPLDGGAVCSPRQVRAGVPDDLDDLTCRALGLPGRHGAAPLASVEELRDLLASVQVTSRLALPTGVAARQGETPPTYAAPPAPAGYDPPPVRWPLGAAWWAVVGLVAVIAVALAASLMFGDVGVPGADRKPSGGASSTAPGKAAGEPLRIAGVTSFDPPPDGTGDENGDRAQLAVDSDPGTAWTTKTYLDQFGPSGLKEGVGLVVDLGERRDLTQIRIDVGGGATDLQVRVADRPGATADDFRLVAEASDVAGQATLKPAEAVSARYVLVWLTQLPAVGDGFRGEIAEIAVKG